MRAVLALLLCALAIAGGAFVAGHPGRVEIVWQGWQIDTSVAVLVGAAALLALVTVVLALLIAALWRLPGNLRRRRAARRRRRGEAALTGGIVALAAGQAAEALTQARRADRLLGATPMTLLLTGEAATRHGDRAAARQAYTTLLDRPDTEFLGLRGLIGQAFRDGDDGTAVRLAERARRLRPDARWLAESALVLAARAGDWEGARDLLAGAARHGALSPERARHHRAVALYELSCAAERTGDLRRAAALAAKAQSLAPDLAPAAAQHGRLLIALGRKRAAAKALQRAWRRAPHPDLAGLCLDLWPDAGPLARTAALQKLVAQRPEAPESHLAVAEAALAARLWGEARRHLGAAAGAAASSNGPSRRLCLMMAQLEQGSGNAEAAREWRDRAIDAPPDPRYVCRHCGDESIAWQPLCRECGSFDTLDWGSGRRRPAVLAIPSEVAGGPLMLPAAEGADPAAPPRLGAGGTIG